MDLGDQNFGAFFDEDKIFDLHKKKWESNTVCMLERTYPNNEGVDKRMIFLINTYNEFLENHTFGEYDPFVVVPPDVENERLEIREFISTKFILLKKELSGDLENSSLPATPSKKFKWNGTPGEFGAIMNELISNGFVPKIKDLKNTVRLLNEVFEIRNEKGETVDDNYLYKCFSEKKKSYYPNELKIPFSDNLNKGS